MAVVNLEALRTLQRLIGRLNAGTDLATTLRAVTDGVVEGLGFGVAVVSVVHDDRTVEVVSVSGPQEVSDTLLGNRAGLASWERAFERAEPWGLLRYEPHELADEDDLPSWVPDAEPVDDDDAWHPLDALFAPLHSVNGELVGILSVDLPESGRKPDELQCELLEMYAVQAGIALDNARLAERLRASEESFRLAFDNAPVGMSLIDFAPASAGRFLRVNEAMCRMLGYSRRELESRTVFDITHPDDQEVDRDTFARAASGRLDSRAREKRYLRSDGQTIWVSVHTSVVHDASGSALYGISQFEDISDRHAAHQELAHRARHDPLTGLLNRTELAGRVQASILGAQRTRQPGALLFCDLDRFKPVNDTHGHAVGDQVLAIIARRLESQLRSGDTVARFGGDEFVVVADDLSGPRLADLVGRLQGAVAMPIEVDGLFVELSVTIGTATISGSSDETVDDLVTTADLDMYLRKPDPRPVPDEPTL